MQYSMSKVECSFSLLLVDIFAHLGLLLAGAGRTAHEAVQHERS